MASEVTIEIVGQTVAVLGTVPIGPPGPPGVVTASDVVDLFAGTPDGSLFLRDDGTLALPPGGGGGGGQVNEIVEGAGISVDSSDPEAPVVTAEVTQAELDSEATTRGNADTALAAAIVAEADEREAADDGLQAQLDDLPATFVALAETGAADGVAELDGAGLVPSSQLPAYVDDVVDVANFAALPVTGEAGKIYVTLDTNLTYRWSGSAYVEISASLALGETSATAYRGDRGKAAYDHSLLTSGNPHNVTKANVGLGNADNTSDANKPVSTATQAALDAKLSLAAGGASVENIGAIESNVNTVAASGATETLDTSLFGVHDVTMDQACTFTFSNPAPSGKATIFTLILRGAFTPTLPASIDWPGTPPTYTSPAQYVFTTVDAGTTWLGQQVGKAFA